MRVITLTLLLSMASVAVAQQPSAPAAAPPSPKIAPAPPEHKFPNGQSYTYAVEWRLFTAGTASLKIDSAGREMRVTSAADAGGVVSVLYHVHDRVEAFFDSQTFCSRALTKHTEEGRRRLDTNIVFDYAKKKSLLDEKNLKDNKTKHEENDIPECVSDVVSSIFYIGAQPLTAGSGFSFPLNDGGKTAEVKVAVEGRESLKTTAGDFKTVRVRIQSDTGKLKEKGAIWIWYSDDAARIPVLMKARLFWGALLFKLQKTELVK